MRTRLMLSIYGVASYASTMKHFSAAMLALGIMLASVAAAGADTTTCTGTPTPGSTIDGNLIVTSGATCTMRGVTVTGNVQVQMNATLEIFTGHGATTIDGNLRVGTGAALVSFGLTVHGNVIADHCEVVEMSSVTVDGNVDIQNCTNTIPKVTLNTVTSAKIAGNVDCSNNSPGCDLTSSGVKGNVQISNNFFADVGSVGINTIGGNLQCFGNEHIIGGNNTVGGHKQGQCAGF